VRAPARLPALLLAGALLAPPSAAAGDPPPPAPSEAYLTVLGREHLGRCPLVLRGRLEKVQDLKMGAEIGVVALLETLWGRAPAKDRVSILTHEAGYFARVPPEAVFFLEPLADDARFACRGVVDVGGTDGPARLAAVRRSLRIEAMPAAEKGAALRAACFEGLGAEDPWTRRNAARETAHLSLRRPRAFSEEDLRDLRRRGLRERDPILRPLLVEVVEHLDRAAAEGRLAPPDPNAPTLRGAPLLRTLREDPDPAVRRRAAAAAAGEGPGATAALAAALAGDADATVRAAAAEALGAAGVAAAAVDALVAAAGADADAAVRVAAVETLGLLGAAPAIPALRRVAQKDPPAARAALFALARIRTPEALEALAGIRAAAADAAAAGVAGAAEARDLVDFLRTPDFLRQEEALRRVRGGDGTSR
jgi:HEAT repeat protein